ncbi:MAG: translation initiation factor IF-2 [Verrucomicrobia bacterium]|nr:translation initiation factor IF-2 [Verrucomicrobiota bacterium]
MKKKKTEGAEAEPASAERKEETAPVETAQTKQSAPSIEPSESKPHADREPEPVRPEKATDRPVEPEAKERAEQPEAREEAPPAKPQEDTQRTAQPSYQPRTPYPEYRPRPSHPHHGGEQQREGGYAPGPRREGGGGYAPSGPRREGGGGYAPGGPRREGGGYAPGGPRRDGGGGYTPGGPRREGGGGYVPGGPRREGGGYAPGGPRREGGGGYVPGGPRREGSGYAPGGPRREGGGYAPGGPRREGGGGYAPGGPRREGGGYVPGGPRREGYSPMSRPSIPGKEAHGEPRKSPPSKEPSKPDVREEEGKKTAFKDFREYKPSKKGGPVEKTFDSRDRQGLRDDLDEQSWRKKRPSHKMRPIQQEEIIRPKELKVRLPISVKDLASEMKLKASQLISKLFMKGVVITLNDLLDDETTIQLLGHDFDCEITIDTAEEDRVRITDKTIKEEIQESDPTSLILRPPVAAFMGHVDHGKTSLIDSIRKSNLASGEAGEITQHIGAFKCHTPVGDLTILDTPGHEAFSAMRARGADVTDIIVLVVAGDEGIRAQTIEAINQAQTANVPIVVAINKSDKPNFNADNVYRQLADQNLLPEAWGGTTITVNCSAVTGAGIKELLEMLALQAEILELKANPVSRARGSVIESEMHKGMGAVATVLVQNGTLRLGDAIVFAQHFARVKTMQDEHGRDVSEATPSTPVKITGLSGLPEAGSEFIVVANEKEARELAEKRSEGKRNAQQLLMKRAGLESLLQDKQTAQKKILNLILRGDVQGSVEALKISLQKIQSNKVEINFISTAVGEISESDVQLAAASKATILGFHTQIESHAESLIKKLKVTVKMHDIIYHAVDDIRELMLNLLDKIPQESDTGTAEVVAVFKASQLGVIAGCMVTDGLIKRSHSVRLIREGQVVWKGAIASLKRVKEDVKEISKGFECGILLQNYNEVKVGDKIQAFEITYLTQEL